MHHKIRTSTSADADDFDAGFETWTVAYATPTGPGRCRLFARFPFRFPPPKPRKGVLGMLPAVNLPALLFSRVPDWVQHLGQLKVLDDDNIFLPLQVSRKIFVESRTREGYAHGCSPTPLLLTKWQPALFKSDASTLHLPLHLPSHSPLHVTRASAGAARRRRRRLARQLRATHRRRHVRVRLPSLVRRCGCSAAFDARRRHVPPGAAR